MINRSSTGRFVTAMVYIGFPLFALPKECSGNLFSMPCRARGTVMFCANKHVGVPSCWARPAQPPRRAPPDTTRPWCVRVLDSTGLQPLVMLSRWFQWHSFCFVKVCLYRMMRHGRLSPRDGIDVAKSYRIGPHIDRQANKSLLGLRSIDSPRNDGRIAVSKLRM